LAVYFNSFAQPAPPTYPASITTGPGSSIYYTFNYVDTFHQTSYRLGVGILDTTTHAIREVLVASPGNPNSNTASQAGVATGSDGNIWFTDPLESKIGFVNPTTLAFTVFSTPTANSGPTGIVAGPDGNLWFTEAGPGKIGMINVTTHVITEFPLPNNSSFPEGITNGPDGNLWFTEFGTNSIGEINPTTHAISEFPLSGPTNGPVNITTGPDGNLWFTIIPSVFGSTSVGEINPTTHAVSEFAANASGGITNGPDGQVWFTAGSKISEINPTTHAITSYAIPLGSDPSLSIVTGHDGNLWVGAANFILQAVVIPANQAAIFSNVYLDPAANGTFVGGPLAGRTVYVDLKGDGHPDGGDPTAVTDSNGTFTIAGLTPGTYTVRVLTYPGDDVTYPASQGQTITVSGGQLGQLQTFGLLTAGATLPLTVNPSPFGAHNPDVSTAEVNGMYHLILGRAPDATGGPAAVAYLKNGGSLTQLASNLLHSAEYDTDLAVSDYKNYLGRSPSQADINAVVASLQGGSTANQIAQILLGSQEFSVLHASNADFVTAAYEDTLGRPPSASEITNVVSVLNSGLSRPALTQSLLVSYEADVRSVNGLYFTILAQTSDTEGLSFWVSGLQAGTALLDEAIQFFGSTTFQSRANATVG
jgi:streptogramin lyase